MQNHFFGRVRKCPRATCRPRPDASTDRPAPRRADGLPALPFSLTDHFCMTTPPLPLLNRELGLIEFNRRVLSQAEDTGVPLLERLKFLCIVSSNLDEFFEIRVASLKKRNGCRPARRCPTACCPARRWPKGLAGRAWAGGAQYWLMREVLFPALAEEGIHFVRRAEGGPPRCTNGFINTSCAK